MCSFNGDDHESGTGGSGTGGSDTYSDSKRIIIITTRIDSRPTE